VVQEYGFLVNIHTEEDLDLMVNKFKDVSMVHKLSEDIMGNIHLAFIGLESRLAVKLDDDKLNQDTY
jgi:hypothetical protein